MDDLPERTLRVNDGVGGTGFVAIPVEQLGKLTPQGLALHAALLSYGWRGSCWPGMDKLGARTRMGEKALRAAKTELIEAGLLDQTRRGQGKPNLYVVRTWDQRRAESRSSQAQVLNPPLGRHEVDEEEVDVVLSNERTTSDPSSEPFSGPSRPTSKTADSNGNRMVPPPDRAERLRQAAGVLKLCYRLAELMLENDPKAKPKPSSVGWMTAAEKLMRIDKRPFDECMVILEWCQQDEFWKGNVLSMPKFREKYPTLRAQWLRSFQQRQSAAAAPVSSAELAAAFDRGPSRSGL